MLEIKKLTATDGEDIFEMLQEMPADENGFVNSVYGKTYEEYKVWLAKSEVDSKQSGLIDGWKVPQTTFWLYENGKPVGMGKIRHFLTDALRSAGGNIGYAIRPSERGRGLGKRFAGLLIDGARKMNIPEMLITVHDDNIASVKAALANGGTIEKVENGRYYISVPSESIGCAR